MKITSDYKYYFNEFYPLLGLRLIYIWILSTTSVIVDLLSLSVMIPYIGGLVTGNPNELIPEKIQQYIIFIGFENNLFPIILASLIFKVMISLLNNYFKSYLVKEVTMKLRFSSLKHLFYSDYSALQKLKPAEVEFALSSEFQNIGNLIKTFINNLSRLFIFLAYIFLLFKVLGIKVVGVSLLYSAVVYTIFYFVQIQVKNNSEIFSRANNKYLEFINSGIENIRFLSIKSLKQLFLYKTFNHGKKADHKYYLLRLTEGILVSLREPLIITLILSIIFTSRSLFQIDLDNITLGLAIFWRTYNSFFEYLSSYNNMSSLKGSYINFKSILDKLNQSLVIKSNNHRKELSNIVISNLSFKLNDKILFDEINISLVKGDFVLLTGESGSGKSTFLNVLLGIEMMNSGEISIYDSKHELMSFNDTAIGFVDQKSVVFNDTLYNNLTMWAPVQTEIEHELESLTNLFPNQLFLKELHKDLNHKTLSGGQKQLINIIREIFLDPDILILDEPTSSLDEKSRNIVFEILNNISRNKIIIMITHNDSSLINYNKEITFKH